jgi:hypothetical protein
MCFRPDLGRSIDCYFFPVGSYTIGESTFLINVCKHCRKEEKTGEELLNFIEMLEKKGARIELNKEGEEMIKFK